MNPDKCRICEYREEKMGQNTMCPKCPGYNTLKRNDNDVKEEEARED